MSNNNKRKFRKYHEYFTILQKYHDINFKYQNYHTSFSQHIEASKQQTTITHPSLHHLSFTHSIAFHRVPSPSLALLTLQSRLNGTSARAPKSPRGWQTV